MKRLVSFIAICSCVFPAFAATEAAQSRRSMTTQMVMAAPRATASTKQISAMANNAAASMNTMSSVRVPVGLDDSDISVSDDSGNDSNEDNNQTPDDNEDKNKEYERQRSACLNNNVGLGNTFVWASRYSNVNNYSSMVEDVNNPENNTCFVLVEIKSSDPNIKVSDIPTKYFPMGQNITCGSWAQEETLRKRILDSKKTARTWATVGGTALGIGVGVGAMEWFGNKLIGGAVEGQYRKDITEDERLLMQLRALKNDKPSEYDKIRTALEVLENECDNWRGDDKPAECNSYNYKYLLED